MHEEKLNLTRIRDNQRRSRARRKEYLQELETKLRQCELQGVEVSIEIQTAARRVADENIKLRGLLAQNGIDKNGIEIFLGDSENPDRVTSGQSDSMTGNSVRILEESLSSQRSCCKQMTLQTNETIMAGENSQNWDTAHLRPEGGRESTLESSKAFSSTGQPMIPNDMPNRSYDSHSSHYSQPPSQPHVARYTQQVPRKVNSISMSPCPQGTESNTQHPTPPYNISSEGHSKPYKGVQKSLANISTTARNRNVNRCSDAVNMITTMAGADLASVRADLGCSSGVECDVDNQIVFEVMDRYSGRMGP